MTGKQLGLKKRDKKANSKSNEDLKYLYKTYRVQLEKLNSYNIELNRFEKEKRKKLKALELLRI